MEHHTATDSERFAGISALDIDVVDSEAARSGIVAIPTVAHLQKDPESVSKRHKLIILSNPEAGHQVWEGTLGSHVEAGSLHFQSSFSTSVSIPPIEQGFYMDHEIELTVSIQSIKLNPSIQAEISVYRGDGHLRKRVYTANVNWPFNAIKDVDGSKKSGVTALMARINNSSRYMELSFIPECAKSENLLPILYNASLLRMTANTTLTNCECQTLYDLAEFVQNPNSRSICVRFDINDQECALLAAGNTQTKHGQLLDQLPTIQNLAKPGGCHPDYCGPRWKYYRQNPKTNISEESVLPSSFEDSQDDHERIEPISAEGDDEALKPENNPLQVLFNSMKSRHSVLSRPHPGTPVKPKMIFYDQDDALVTLAYGAFLELEEQNMAFQAVRRNAHYTRLCSVDTRVLALINFSSSPQTGLPNDRFRLDDRTKVDLVIGNNCMLPDTPHCRKASGLIVANVFNLPSCDLLVLIADKWASYFKDIAQPIEVLLRDSGRSAPRTLVHVSPVLFKSPTKTEIEAVIRSYGPGCSKERLPFLLSDGSKLETKDPVGRVARDSIITPAYQRLKAAKPWNAQQRQAILSIGAAPGGSMIVTGPGGTGKTELICHLVQFAIGCGQFALISGTRNDTLDDMTIKINRMDPTLKPLRLYAQSQEGLDSLYRGIDKSVAAGSGNQLLVNTFDAIENDSKRTRRALPQYSVLSRVLQNISRDKPYMLLFRSPIPGAPKQRLRRDCRAYLRDRLSLLYENKFSEKLPWINGDEEKEFILQAYKCLREEVIKEARVVLSTNVISGSRELKYCFAVNCNIWLFQDEAQSMTEASALIPLSLNNPSKEGERTRKVCMHFLSGDLNQLPPFTISRTGRDNCVNEFAFQRSISLMERKLNSAFPAIELVEQRRAAEILMRGANMFHYGGKLITPDYPALAPEYQNLIPSLAGFKMLPHHRPEKRRIAWLEVNSRVYENRYTGSRANPLNAVVVRRCLVTVQQTFGKQTNAKVMLATPYKRQKELYLGIACEMKTTYSWSDKEIPRIVTIDSLIGRESSLVILDLVNNGTEGFLRDVRRSCVAFTRAKDMFLVVGGVFPLPSEDKLVKPETLRDPVTGQPIHADMSRPLAFYHAFFKANGFLYHCNTVGLPKPQIPSDLRVLGHDVEEAQIEQDFRNGKSESEDGWELVDAQEQMSRVSLSKK